jgi:hypothetical protein
MALESGRVNCSWGSPAQSFMVLGVAGPSTCPRLCERRRQLMPRAVWPVGRSWAVQTWPGDKWSCQSLVSLLSFSPFLFILLPAGVGLARRRILQLALCAGGGFCYSCRFPELARRMAVISILSLQSVRSVRLSACPLVLSVAYAHRGT